MSKIIHNNKWISLNASRVSVVGFSLFSVYILSFLFEGQVLYSLLDLYETECQGDVSFDTFEY